MNFNLKKPCASCPFRNDIKPFITQERVADIVFSIVDQQGTFSCHKTLASDNDGETLESEKTEHCAGALIMLEKMQKPNQMMRWMERFGLYDRNLLEMDSPVFENEFEFVDAQESV